MSTVTDALTDRFAIVDLVNLFADLIDGKQWDRFDEVLADDAEVRWSADAAFAGREEIVAAMQSMLATDEVLTVHLVGSFTPLIDGDDATADIRVQCMHNGVGRREGRYYETQGFQVTRFARTTSGWRIAGYDWRPVAELGDVSVFEA